MLGRQRVLLGLATLAGASALAWGLADRFASRGASDDRAGESQRLRALELRVASLEARLRRVHQVGGPEGVGIPHVLAPSAPAQTNPDPAPVAAATTKPDVPAPKSAISDEVAIEREYFGALDTKLLTETRDPLWAQTTEERLRETTPDDRSPVRVDSVQCGKTMCRVDLAAIDPRDEALALDRFITRAVTQLPEAVVRDGEGPGRHIVYLARPGTKFPPMNGPEVVAR